MSGAVIAQNQSRRRLFVLNCREVRDFKMNSDLLQNNLHRFAAARSHVRSDGPTRAQVSGFIPY